MGGGGISGGSSLVIQGQTLPWRARRKPTENNPASAAGGAADSCQQRLGGLTLGIAGMLAQGIENLPRKH